MRKLPWWKNLLRIMGLVAALWALYSLLQRHYLMGN